MSEDCVANKQKISKQDAESESSPDNPSRRSFLNKLWMGMGLAAIAEFAWLVFTYLAPNQKRTADANNEAKVIAGPVNQYPLDTVTAFIRGKFYLCRLQDGGFIAVSRQCTHLGCTIPWDDEKKRFICPCHSSTFDIRGEVINLPAPRALDIYPVSIINNMVQVDTGKRMRRNGFETNQLVYPEQKETKSGKV
jgi:cytochrome b6-f complex iron-sulfur subunit